MFSKICIYGHILTIIYELENEIYFVTYENEIYFVIYENEIYFVNTYFNFKSTYNTNTYNSKVQIVSKKCFTFVYINMSDVFKNMQVKDIFHR